MTRKIKQEEKRGGPAVIRKKKKKKRDQNLDSYWVRYFKLALISHFKSIMN